MSTFRGKDGVVKVGGNSVAEVKNWSVEESADTEEDTAMGDTARTFKAGLSTWTGSIEAHWDDTDATGQEALTIGAEVALTLYPETDGVGSFEWSGTAIVTGITVEVPMDNIISRSFTVQGSGALAKGAA